MNPYRGKYRNAMSGGSKLEESVFQILQLREKAKEIRNLRRQHTLVLQEGPREIRICWRVDFSFEEFSAIRLTWDLAFAEAKGFEDEVYKLKLKLFRAKPQGKLEIWKGNYRSPLLVETIHPVYC
jgi:hypothetical protein